jgi:hypothetical protein
VWVLLLKTGNKIEGEFLRVIMLFLVFVFPAFRNWIGLEGFVAK